MEHVSTGTLIIILVIMIVVSAYFSASETGMMTLNRYRLRHLSKQGNRSARRVEKLLQKPDRLIGLVLIGNNLVNILASALATIVGIGLSLLFKVISLFRKEEEVLDAPDESAEQK